MEKLILTDEKIEIFGNELDEIAKWKDLVKNGLIAGIFEMLDGRLFKEGLRYLNNNFSDDVLEKFHDNLNDLIDCIVTKEYESLITLAQETIMEIGNIKFLSDGVEAILIKNLLIGGVEAFQYYAQNKA